VAELVSRFRPGSQQRGEDTRRRILDAALHLFAMEGFEGTGTRALAERAEVNQPAIQYYFGSKEGLYRAVVDEIIQDMVAHIGPVAERIQAGLATAGTQSRAMLTGWLCDLTDALLALMLADDPGREARQKFFARMEAEPDAAFEALQAEMVRHVMLPMSALIGQLTGQPEDSEPVRLRALTLIGQAKIFCGWSTTGVLRWDTIGEERVRAVQTLIRSQIQAIFA
jgi:AcrR family transcriptional regulator